MDEKLSKNLGILGLKIGKGHESRILTVLRAVVDATEEQEDAVTFGEIYEALQREDNFHVSKAWVHRIIKNLVDLGIIRVESGEAMRRRYIGNVDTVVSGLERLKEESEEKFKYQIVSLEEQMNEVSSIDCGTVGQNLIETLTGKPQKLRSRFITGVDELHRVLQDQIHAPAGPGDIIRTTMSWGGPWVKSPRERLIKYIESARRGVDVRWIVDAQVLLSNSVTENYTSEEVAGFFSEFFRLVKEGYKFEVRVASGGMAYNQSSRNDEALALIITEDPPTATFATRDFNKELIDAVIKSFDTLWDTAISFANINPEEMQRIGVLQNPFMASVIRKLAENQGAE